MSLVAQQRRAVTVLSTLKIRAAWPTAQRLAKLLGCDAARAQVVLGALVDRGILSVVKSGKAQGELLCSRTRTALRAKEQLLAPCDEENKLLAQYGLGGDTTINKSSSSDQEIESDETLADQDDANKGSGNEYKAMSSSESQSQVIVPSKSKTVPSDKQPRQPLAKQATKQPSAQSNLTQIARKPNATTFRTSDPNGNQSSNRVPAPMHVQTKRKYGLRPGPRKSFQFPRDLVASQRTTAPTPSSPRQHLLPTVQPSQKSDESFDLTPSGVPRPLTQDSDPIQSPSPTGKTRAQQPASKAGKGKSRSKRVAPIDVNDDDDE